jgi:Xaa-Pro aminopeptidase
MSASPATRRERLANHQARQGDTSCLLIASGVPLPIAGTDQSLPFHGHPEFRYLAGVEVPGSTLAFDPDDGWTLFAPQPSQEERIWSGDGVSFQSLSATASLDRVRPTQQLDGWLEERRGRPFTVAGNHDIVRWPGAYGSRAWHSLEPDIDESRSVALSESIAEARRAKDADELDNMRAAVAASCPGHLAAMHVARPGMTERQLQIELEVEFARAGSPRTAYGSIVGTGADGAVLHFAPGTRELRDGDLVLIDAAAEWNGYAADITRTFPVSGRFDGIQRDLYQLVANVQQEAIDAVRPGIEYRDLHMRAAHAIAEGLVDLDILRGDPAELVERDAHAIFFPHGLGHMLGLSTHDAGGCLAGRAPSDRFGLKSLRADLPLEENYVITIEPGIYFIRALLTDVHWRERYRTEVNWPRVDQMLDFGGIRIEDDVRVTANGSEVLSTGTPKSIEDIEAIRREAPRS